MKNVAFYDILYLVIKIFSSRAQSKTSWPPLHYAIAGEMSRYMCYTNSLSTSFDVATLCI